MHSQQEHKRVVLVLARLNLIEHGLCLLEQDERLFKALLRDEVDGTFVQLVYYNWDLVCSHSKDELRVGFDL